MLSLVANLIDNIQTTPFNFQIPHFKNLPDAHPLQGLPLQPHAPQPRVSHPAFVHAPVQQHEALRGDAGGVKAEFLTARWR